MKQRKKILLFLCYHISKYSVSFHLEKSLYHMLDFLWNLFARDKLKHWLNIKVWEMGVAMGKWGSGGWQTHEASILVFNETLSRLKREREILCFSSYRLIDKVNPFMLLTLIIYCHQEYFWGIYLHMLLFLCVILMSDEMKQWVLCLGLSV